MRGSEPSQSFRDAASFLSNASALRKVSNAVKLELYGLFKWLTVTHEPDVSRPSIFDMTGRAKWDAWDAAGKRYSDVQEAENRYLEIARDLGWQPGAPKKQEEAKSEDIWDSESSNSEESHGGGGGLGVSVSSVVAPEIEDDNTLHGLAIAGDAQKLHTLISLDQEINLNGLDEFGYTPLHLACDRGNVDVVRQLLAKGADTSIKDPDEMTSLELARTAGHEEIVKLLSG
ncbi:hypothetical protein D9757_005368 [Collybiopsis confluens]|uniref:ACB domain-containing protein n=1 Tax=Collybiopsis confluens TaxID=2823264 RepID=A0A8H5HLP0_9AGAR|nr:hypothetical protein D9757_005368 [Collybiopsis confluens]